MRCGSKRSKPTARDSTRRLVRSYDRLAALSAGGFSAGGLDPAFTQTDVRVLSALKDMDLRRWERFGGDIVDTLHSSLMDSVVSGERYADTVAALEETLLGMGEEPSRFEARARTLANTLTQAFDRTVTNRRAAEADVDTFVYLGPEDSLTRPFCRAVLDGGGDAEFGVPEKDEDPPVYALDEIEGMDNGAPGLPVMQFGGGYNCRHKFRPISKRVAEEVLS